MFPPLRVPVIIVMWCSPASLIEISLASTAAAAYTSEVKAAAPKCR